MMNCRSFQWIGFVVLGATLVPTTVVAQTFTYSFDELHRILRVGEQVVVTDRTGGKTTGKLAELSPSRLVIRTRDTRTFSDAEVVEIRRTDSNWDGALIGLGAGCLGTWSFVRYNCGPAGYDDECAAIAGLAGLAFVPGGALVGALIDRAVGNNSVYFGTVSRVSITISPLVGRARTGFFLALQF